MVPAETVASIDVTEDASNKLFCAICNEVLNIQDNRVETSCKHQFHINCISTWFETKNTCPVCRNVCGSSDLKTIRSGAQLLSTPQQSSSRSFTQSRRGRGGATKRPVTRAYPQTNSQNNSNADAEEFEENEDNGNDNANDRRQSYENRRGSSRFRKPRYQQSTVSEETVKQLLADSLNTFRSELTTVVVSQIQSALSNLNIQETRHNPPTIPANTPTEEAPVWPREMPYVEASSRANAEASSHANTSRPRPDSLPLVFDRISPNERTSNIIKNWRLKFTGADDGMTIDQFIYRVNTLTSLHLRGRFNVLCEHIHSLYEGKAQQWFWRYHRQVENLDWFDLCDAMRRQFKEYTTDFDIKDDIRRRKQKASETFVEFLDSVMCMSDKLRVPMSDSELVETVIRNLKPELRHELLHLNITDITVLKREVRKHEKFFKDFQSADMKAPDLKTPLKSLTKKKVSAVEAKIEDSDEEDDINAIDASKLKCWNCENVGHRYQDCLKPRRIFCYGCGAVDTYKPSCPKCIANSENSKSDVRRVQSGRPQNQLRK